MKPPTNEERSAVIAEVHAMLRARDPELLAAVADVDRTLIRAWLQRSPWERAEMSFDAAEGIEELRKWRRVG